MTTPMTIPDLIASLPEIADRIDRAEAILLGLDFDGTLTPIRSHPDDAVLAQPVRDVLARLARNPRVKLMIVSGRGLADVASRVGLPDTLYAGNHGLEIQGPGISFIEPTAAALVDPLNDLTTLVEKRLAHVPAAIVERKGLTSSVHYRNAPPELWDAIGRVMRDVVADDPDRFVLTAGHKVWEIRPRVSWHKGQAILWVLRHLGTPEKRLAIYLGDDRTDEDAFASLPDGLTVRVGDASTPTRARYRVADPAAVERFLVWFVERLPAEG